MLFFDKRPEHKVILRRLAIVWSLLIVLLCFAPSREMPKVNIPFADKWVHFIIFGIFAFLWLSAIYRFKKIHLLFVFIITCIFGWLVEVLQGQLSFLGRSQDNMDTLADAFGGLLGVISFYICHSIIYKKNTKDNE